MYYINKAISYRVDFINSVSKNWHCISKVSLDYVNKECMFEISSYDNEEDFRNKNLSYISQCITKFHNALQINGFTSFRPLIIIQNISL